MGSAHSFFVHVPNWAGFVILIGIWIIFRSFLLRWRGNAMDRMKMGRMMPPTPLPPGHVTYGQVRCPRCSAMAAGVAMFCPHCGLSFASLPPAVPQAQWAGRRRDQKRGMLVWVVLGVIGLMAYVFWRKTAREDTIVAPEVPEQVHRHYHYP